MSASLTPKDALPISRASLAQIAGLAGLLLWAYWPMLANFFDKWSNDPQYSHGFLVPLFSGYLLWKAWQCGPVAFLPRPVLGCVILGVVLALRLAAGRLLSQQLDAFTFLLCLTAGCLAWGGVPLIRRTWPAIAFLVFMIPLPHELERNVGQPLKTAATVSSTFLLQTFGQPALRDGNIILIDEVKLGVVDACSGLKMMMTFAVFSIGAVLLMRRTRFEKFMIVLGIVPIAIIANVLRITATGFAYLSLHDKETLNFLHDLFGWMMMPIGLGLLAVELWVLKRLVVDEPATDNATQAMPMFATA
jgi:exosortase